MANYKKTTSPQVASSVPNKPQMEPLYTESANNAKELKVDKIGTFISLNTINVKGLRLNLDKVFSYAPNGENSIQFAQGDGNQTTLSFGSKEDMLAALDYVDSKCQ